MNTGTEVANGNRRIALLLPDLRGGGAERVAVVLCRRLVELGHHIDLVLFQAVGELLPLVPKQVDIVDLAADRFRHGLWQLSRHLRLTRPDVVLASMWPLTIVAVVAAFCAGIGRRVVVSDHSILSASPQAIGWRRRMLMRSSIGIGYRLAKARIAVSAGVAEDVAELGRLDRSSFAVIGNPIAVGIAGNGAEPLRPPWSGSVGKRILSVGSLKAVKDQATLIRAFAKVRERIAATLVILGEGTLRSELEQLIADVGLGESVQLPGFALDPSPWYAAADLFVLSSRNEGFGNVIVEALMHGTPVVSTDCRSGPREVLDGGRFGRLVPVGDADALAEAIVDGVQSDVDCAALRRRAADFSVETIAQRYLDALFPADLRDPAIEGGR